MKRYVLVLVIVLIFGGAGFVFVFNQPQVAHAQLSCDLPPAPLDDLDLVTRLQRVWDKTDFCKFNADALGQIISGGVPRDGIPPMDDPTFDSIENASEWLQPQSPVITVELDGQARAYPLAILTRHEIVNDVFDEIPIAVTFCPLCNSAIVFDRRFDGHVMRFGVSGLLRNSDLIMWDDVTQTWWQQFTGEGIVGTYTDELLDILPSQVVGFGAFVEQFPDGEVLSPRGRSYGTNPYTNYDSSAQPFLFAGTPDSRLFATERVLAGVIGGEAVAYPFERLAEEKVVNDVVGGQDVVIFWQSGATSALDGSNIDTSRDVGMAAMFNRELDGRVLRFIFDEESGTIRDEQTGSAWNVFGESVEGELAGSRLPQEIAAPHFWFAWAAFEPETTVYGQE